MNIWKVASIIMMFLIAILIFVNITNSFIYKDIGILKVEKNSYDSAKELFENKPFVICNINKNKCGYFEGDVVDG